MLFVGLVAVLHIMPLYAHAVEIDDVGFNVFYGQGTPINEKHWGSDMYTFRVNGLSMELGKYLDEDEKWELEIGPEVRFYDASGEDVERSGTSIGIKMCVKRRFRSATSPVILFIGGNGGFSWLPDRENQPDFGDSGVLGTFGACFGAEYPFDGFSLYVGAELTHTSDPLNNGGEEGDFGRNLLYGVVGAKFEFGKLRSLLREFYNEVRDVL